MFHKDRDGHRGRYRRAKVAAAPGTLLAPEGAHESSMTVIAYGPDSIHEGSISDAAELDLLLKQYTVVWVNVVGLGDVSALGQLGSHLGLHPLAMEDALNVPQRPKLDSYADHLFITARMPIATEFLKTEQLSMFLGDGYLITFQERPGDCLDGVRKRIRDGRERMRNGAADYLTYTILDALVDSYFPLLETVGEVIDDLETRVLQSADAELLPQLHSLKRDLITLRRYLWPLREVNNSVLRNEAGRFANTTVTYLRDCYDHTVQAIDLVDSSREMASSLVELYLSMASQRMNDVMKVLTIIATIFIPLSFIAGLYGMNFNGDVSRWNMPELNWAFGYPAALGIMLLTALTMVGYFWRKGWFR